MERNWRRTRRVRVAYLVLAGLALANGGCLVAAAGAAGGAAVGYAYYQGKVSQDFAATFEDTWAAAHTALAELGMPVEGETRESATTGSIDSRDADNNRVRIALESLTSPIPAEGILTRVGVRVGTFGDHPLSERVLSQVGAHLVPRAVAAPPGTPVLGPIQTSPSGTPLSRTTPGPVQAVSPAGFTPQTAEPPLLNPRP
jgi:Protein of unknown function (DUF3568)